jgi:glycerol dehydratase small subunit/propanediol dehydratase small subunit
MSFGIKDYPLAEKHADSIKGARGKALSDITLDAVLDGSVTIEDLRITPQALAAQADVARSAGRPRLADNFLRAADLVSVPQDAVMRAYELLRPGRAKSKDDLAAMAKLLRETYKAERIASFIEEAADVYDQRGLFTKRY